MAQHANHRAKCGPIAMACYDAEILKKDMKTSSQAIKGVRVVPRPLTKFQACDMQKKQLGFGRPKTRSHPVSGSYPKSLVSMGA